MRNYTKKLEKEIEQLQAAVREKEMPGEIEQVCLEEEKGLPYNYGKPILSLIQTSM